VSKGTSFKLRGRRGVAAGQGAIGIDPVDEVLEQREEKAQRVENTARQVERETGNVGLADAIRHTPVDWRDLAEAAVREAAKTGKPFTAYTLTGEPYNLPEPGHPNQWGALFSYMKRHNVVTTTERGFTTSGRPKTAGSAVREWVGTADWIAKGRAA
jgi:hypothetical protein